MESQYADEIKLFRCEELKKTKWTFESYNTWKHFSRCKIVYFRTLLKLKLFRQQNRIRWPCISFAEMLTAIEYPILTNLWTEVWEISTSKHLKWQRATNDNHWITASILITGIQQPLLSTWTGGVHAKNKNTLTS